MRATSTEAANGSTATITRNLTVNVLTGTVTATPVGVNPYVSYANSTAVTATTFGNNAIVVSPLVPVASSCTFGVSAAAIAASVQADATESLRNNQILLRPPPNPDWLRSRDEFDYFSGSESDATMEAWMQSLSESISRAFLAEMERLGRYGGEGSQSCQNQCMTRAPDPSTESQTLPSMRVSRAFCLESRAEYRVCT